MTLSDIYLANIEEMTPLVLLALGLTYVIVGSKIGYPIRFTVCLILYKMRLRWFRSLVTCPPCNAWWTAGAITLCLGYPVWQVIQLAFTTCGIVAVLQAHLGGDGLAAAEDFDDLFGVKETTNGD